MIEIGVRGAGAGPVLDEEVPPAPDEIEFGDVATDAAGAMVLGEAVPSTSAA